MNNLQTLIPSNNKEKAIINLFCSDANKKASVALGPDQKPKLSARSALSAVNFFTSLIFLL